MFTCVWRFVFGTAHGRVRPVDCMAALSVSCHAALGGRCKDLVTAGVNKSLYGATSVGAHVVDGCSDVSRR